MSLISLASVRALQEDAVAEGRARPGRVPGAADAQERIVGQLVAFIPAESVTLFIALLAAVGTDAGEWVRWTLLGIVAVRDEVWLPEAHRPEALRVAAGNQSQAAVLARTPVQVEADVEHPLRHAAVEEVAEAVGKHKTDPALSKRLDDIGLAARIFLKCVEHLYVLRLR